MAFRAVVRQKVEAGLPITEVEREALAWQAGNRFKKQKTENEIIAAAAKLMLKPQSVSELRLLVETTAAKHHYNPIESLIEQTRSPDIKESEKIAIHKALLPFLVPQLAAPKSVSEASDTGVKVMITSFVFPEHRAVTPIHAEKMVTAASTPKEQNTPA